MLNKSESAIIITASNSAFMLFWLLLRLTLNDKFKVYELQQDKLRLFSCTLVIKEDKIFIVLLAG